MLNRLSEEGREPSDVTDCVRLSAALFGEVPLPPKGLAGSSRWPRKADRRGCAGGWRCLQRGLCLVAVAGVLEKETCRKHLAHD